MQRLSFPSFSFCIHEKQNYLSIIIFVRYCTWVMGHVQLKLWWRWKSDGWNRVQYRLQQNYCEIKGSVLRSFWPCRGQTVHKSQSRCIRTVAYHETSWCQIWPLGINVSDILIEIHTFSFKKMHLKMPSEKWPTFCLGLNVLTKKEPI